MQRSVENCSNVMPAKRDLSAALGRNLPKQDIQRGPPFHLSPNPEQDAPAINSPQPLAPAEDRTSAQVHKSAEASAIKRTSQGQRLRVDLMREMKRIAFEDERKLYEVMEEAMEQYIERRKASRE